MWEKAEGLYDRLPEVKEFVHLRNSGHSGYIKLVCAKVEAAYFYEEVGKYSKAFQIWYELTRHSAGMFDAVPGLRRASRRVLRNAVSNPNAFLNEIRRLRKRTAD